MTTSPAEIRLPSALKNPPSDRDLEVYESVCIAGRSLRAAAAHHDLSVTRVRQLLHRVVAWLADTLPPETDLAREKQLHLARHIAADQLHFARAELMDLWRQTQNPSFLLKTTRFTLAIARLGVVPGKIDGLFATAFDQHAFDEHAFEENPIDEHAIDETPFPQRAASPELIPSLANAEPPPLTAPIPPHKTALASRPLPISPPIEYCAPDALQRVPPAAHQSPHQAISHVPSTTSESPQAPGSPPLPFSRDLCAPAQRLLLPGRQPVPSGPLPLGG